MLHLMELAEAGKVETIIVKDHSRLGRNRLVVGQLLEEDFVRLHVRYIRKKSLLRNGENLPNPKSVLKN